MSERYEREIDEIIYRLEGRRRRGQLGRRLSQRLGSFADRFRGATRGFERRPRTEQLIIAGMVLAIVGYVLSAFFGLASLAAPISLLSLVLFVAGIALSISHRHGTTYQPRWRGRELRSPRPGGWQRLRRWLRGH